MIDLTVKTLDSRNHSFSLEDDITVRGFKELIAESVAVPAESQRLIYCGRVLQDEKKLIEYDVNGKVIHLVQRAPPQSSQRGNNSGQGQDQGQDQGQGRNSNRPHFRHARAQVRLPRMDGNAMYLGAMTLPTEGENPGFSIMTELCNRHCHQRFVNSRRLLNTVDGWINDLQNPSSETNPTDGSPASSSQEHPQEPELETENQDHEPVQEHDEVSFEIDAGEGLPPVLSAALNSALNNFAALSTAALGSLTVLGGPSDGTSTPIIHAHLQRNNTDGRESTAANSTGVGQSEQSQTAQQTPPQQQQQTPQQQEQQTPPPQQQPQQEATANANATPVSHPRDMGVVVGSLMSTYDNLRPHLERWRDILMADQVLPTGGGPGSVEETQRIFTDVSRCLHHLAHVSHMLSDIIVDMREEPPRTLRCRPFVGPNAQLMQAEIPIQVEAHISLHSRNQNVNNNNETGNAGANPTAPESAASTETTGETQGSANPRRQTETASQTQPQQHPQQQQQQPQQQQQHQTTFGTVFNMPHNVEVVMEVGPDMSGNDLNQQSFNIGNNNNNSARGENGATRFPLGAALPHDFVRNVMELYAGQLNRDIAAATVPNPATSTTGEQPAPNSDGNATVSTAAAAATAAEGSNSIPGQSTQARGNTGTHPTTSTQTRSTPRPHVFHANHVPIDVGIGRRMGFRNFDPYLNCVSHHLVPQRAAPRADANVQQQPQQPRQQPPTTQSSPASDQSQPATGEFRTANVSPENVDFIRQFLMNRSRRVQVETGPGGRFHSFAGGIPVVQGMMGNGSNQARAGMTLMDLLGNTPGIGVSTNIGIIGPLRMDQTLHGEDLLFDLVVTVVQNITLEGWEALRNDHWEPLARVRHPIREFFQNFFGTTPLSGSEDRVVDRLISELQPTLNQLLIEDTNTGDAFETTIDIPATIERLLRRHFLNILRLLFDNDVDDTRFAQGLLASIKALQTEACSVLQYSYRGRQLRIETVAQRIVGRLTEGVEPGIRQWIVTSCVSHVCSYLVHMTQLPDNEVVPLLVLRTTPRSTPPTPLVQQCSVPQTQPESEPMETDVREERVEVEPLEAEEGATFPGHEAVPSDWVPIIARDGVRQRRQLQVQVQSQGMAGSGVGSFSDAYLGGMPSKRRKLIEQQKPRILLSPPPNHSSVSISMERLVRESVGRAGIEEVDGAAAAVATDVGVRRAFGQAIRGCLHQHPQRQTTPDFPDALRFPNATKYFSKHDENSKK